MKKIISIILAAILAFGILPTSAFAEEYEYEDVSGTVYISISSDDKYVMSDGVIAGKFMAYVPVDLAKLREVKLEKRINASDGNTLEIFYYDADGNGKYEITVLQLYLYVLDTYYSGTSSELQISGSPGSLFMQDGFWGHDLNLTYYKNGSYPLAKPGWGATADQIALEDGDFIDVALYESWAFYSNEAAGFHYFENDLGITHEYNTEVGKPLEIKYTRAWGDMNVGCETERVASAGSTIYYGKTFYDEDTAKTVTTDANGEASITFSESGTYYLWAYGEEGVDLDAIVSSPAYCKVIVGGGSGSDTIYGDIDGDGEVGLADVLAMIRYYNGNSDAIAPENMKAADVNGDGEVDLADILEMIRFYNGIIDKFSIDKK